MSYTLRFLPEVEGGVMAAYGWYEDKAVGLGAEFLRGFYAHVAALQRTPLIFSKVHQDFRRGLLQRFPYACYYRVEGGVRHRLRCVSLRPRSFYSERVTWHSS